MNLFFGHGCLHGDIDITSARGKTLAADRA